MKAMKIRTKLLLSFLAVLAIMMLSGVLGVREISQLRDASFELGVKNAPLADAAMEIKLTATTAHLWFEEVMTGAEGKEAMTEVWSLLDEALWYCDAILQGGKNEEGTYYAVENAEIENKISEVKKDVHDFKEAAKQRFANRYGGAAGESALDDQTLDDRFDELFERFIKGSDEAEEMIHGKMDRDAEQLDEGAVHARWILIVANLIGLLVAGFAVYYVTRDIMRQVGGEPATIAGITEQVANGNLEVDLGSKEDESTGIFASVKKMVQSLRAVNIEREEQNWLKTGQAELNEKTSGEQKLVQLAENIINFLTPYVQAQVGAFYVAEEEADGEETILKMIASYAFTWRGNVSNRYKLGEGLVGQAALEHKPILITDLPKEYIHIESGLGQAQPRAVFIIPFLYEDALKGVIELASVHEFTPVQRDFLKQIAAGIGIVVNTAESRGRMQELLEQSQTQAEELQSQTEELQAQQEELQAQQEELRQANEEMELRSRELERGG